MSNEPITRRIDENENGPLSFASAGIAVFKIEFEDEPEFHRCSYYPQLHGGKQWAVPG